jgi:hypothetical protein
MSCRDCRCGSGCWRCPSACAISCTAMPISRALLCACSCGWWNNSCVRTARARASRPASARSRSFTASVLPSIPTYTSTVSSSKDSHFKHASLSVGESVGRVKRRFSVATGCSARLSLYLARALTPGWPRAGRRAAAGTSPPGVAHVRASTVVATRRCAGRTRRPGWAGAPDRGSARARRRPSPTVVDRGRARCGVGP